MVSWRLINLQPRSAFLNMALDESLLRARIADLVPNTLRFYGWKPSAVSIGRFQKIEDELYLDQCATLGVDVVRRMSGGGAVYHDELGEITYCIVAKSKDMGTTDALQVYSKVYSAMTESLHNLGIEADYNEGNLKNCPNLTVKGRKISGSAQTIKSGVVIQHGTLLLKVDLHKMFSLIRVPWAQSNIQVVNVAKDKITSLEEELGYEVSPKTAANAIAQGFKTAFNATLNVGEFVHEEFQCAEKLAKEKYNSQTWTLFGKNSTNFFPLST
jgi:lipoate-protein ligase A